MLRIGFRKPKIKTEFVGVFALFTGSIDTWWPAINALFNYYYYFFQTKTKKNKKTFHGFRDNDGLRALSLTRISTVS